MTHFGHHRLETSRVSFSFVALNQEEQSDIQQGNKMKEKLEGALRERRPPQRLNALFHNVNKSEK